MYTVDTNIKDLQVKERVLSRLFYSLNSPMIATPELGTEEARCFIMVFKEEKTYSSYIGLYLPNSERRFFYVYSGNPVSEAGLSELLEESNRFAEEMGFLLDELNVSGMSVEERNKWIDGQPFFGYVKKAEEKPREAPVETDDAKPAVDGGIQEKAPNEQFAAAIFETAPPAATPAPAPAPEMLTAPPIAPEETPPSETKLDDSVDIPEEAYATPGEPVIPEQPLQKRPTVRRKEIRQSSPPPEEGTETAEDEAKEEETTPQQQRRTAILASTRQKKNQLSKTGTVSKEYEALARLLSSF